MPKSRPRKKKKSATQGKPRQQSHRAEAAQEQDEVIRALREAANTRPPWFDAATKRVLAGVDQLMPADDESELEDAVGRLLGAELHWALHEVGMHLRFSDWFAEVLEAAAQQARDLGQPETSRLGALRLLRGMATIAPPDEVQHALAHYISARKAVQRIRTPEVIATDERAQWVFGSPRVTATGETWVLRNPDTAHIGLLIETHWYRTDRTSIVMVNVDACALTDVVAAGQYPDLDSATAAWAAAAGPRHEGIAPQPVEHPVELLPLVTSRRDDTTLHGWETRHRLDQWFAVDRRLADLDVALDKRGQSLPTGERDYGVTMGMMQWQAEFEESYIERHGLSEEEVVSWVLTQWNEDALPGTEWVIAEHRASWHRAILADQGGLEDGSIDVLAGWIEFLGKKTSAPAEVIERSVAVARGARRSVDQGCPPGPNTPDEE